MWLQLLSLVAAGIAHAFGHSSLPLKKFRSLSVGAKSSSRACAVVLLQGLVVGFCCDLLVADSVFGSGPVEGYAFPQSSKFWVGVVLCVPSWYSTSMSVCAGLEAEVALRFLFRDIPFVSFQVCYFCLRLFKLFLGLGYVDL